MAMGAAETSGRFQFAAVIILTLATSSAVCGLECYCREFINGVISPPPGCRSNNTCVVSDTSIGQCFVERRTQKESRHYLLKYGCLEVQADGISVENALAGLCNVTTAKGLTVSRCCVQENLCNKHIDIPEPTILSSSTTETPPSGAMTVGEQRDMDWAMGTFVTVSLFFVVLVAAVVVFSVLYVLLRRRATTSAMHRV